MDQTHRLEIRLPQLVQEQRDRPRQRRLPGLQPALHEAAGRAALRRLRD